MKILKPVSSKIKSAFLSYVLGLILTKNKKTCSSMAKVLGVTHDFLYRFLSKTYLLLPLLPHLMISLVNHFDKEKLGWLIIDDTTISKPFARFLEGVSQIYNTALGRTDRGLSIVVIAWSNGKITIPLKFGWAFHKDVAGDNYKTKSMIAKELLLFFLKRIKFQYLLIDGHYTTKELLRFMLCWNIKFVGKFACNRKIESSNGMVEQVRNHPLLKLLRNFRSRKIKATYDEMKFYMSSHKRKNRNGEYKYIYLISSMDLSAKEYLSLYGKRWEIETMFRTMKQSLGLAQCCSRKIERQESHIYAVFLSFSFLQNEKKVGRFKNPEQAQRHLEMLKLEDVTMRMDRFSWNFDYVA